MAPNTSAQRRAGKTLDNLVCVKQYRFRNGNPQRLGGLEVDDELELFRLLDGEVARWSSLRSCAVDPMMTPP
jgi:hypothetical protein